MNHIAEENGDQAAVASAAGPSGRSVGHNHATVQPSGTPGACATRPLIGNHGEQHTGSDQVIQAWVMIAKRRVLFSRLQARMATSCRVNLGSILVDKCSSHRMESTERYHVASGVCRTLGVSCSTASLPECRCQLCRLHSRCPAAIRTGARGSGTVPRVLALPAC
jgi:hypothetical protein